MKRTFLIVMVAVLAIASHLGAFAQNKLLFKDLSGLPGVESIYIGPAMLRFATSGDMISKDTIFNHAVRELKSVEVINCTAPSSEKKILDYVSRIIDGNNLEMLLEINSNKEMIKIYGIVPPQGTSVLKSALIIARERDGLSVVYIEGIIDIDKLNRE